MSTKDKKPLIPPVDPPPPESSETAQMEYRINQHTTTVINMFDAKLSETQKATDDKIEKNEHDIGVLYTATNQNKNCISKIKGGLTMTKILVGIFIVVSGLVVALLTYISGR